MVTRVLQGAEYAAFRAISDHPALEDVRLLMLEGEKATDKVQKDRYVELKPLSKVDRETMEEAKRRYPEMAEAWKEIFAPEIKEAKIRAAVEASERYVSREVAIQDVAEQYGMTADDVRAILEKERAGSGIKAS